MHRSKTGAGPTRWLVLLALACGKADEASDADVGTRSGDGVEAAGGSSAGAAGSANAGAFSTDDAGAASAGGGAVAECPAPRSCGSGPDLWSRNPATGACCSYASICEGPEEWPVFSTRDECESSCRCRDVTPSDFSLAETIGDAAFATERTSLECFCSGRNDCPQTFAETATSFCSGSGTTQLSSSSAAGSRSCATSGVTGSPIGCSTRRAVR